MKSKIYTWLADTRGVTGIEYGILTGGIALTIMTGVFFYGDQFNAMHEHLARFMTRS